MMKWSVLINTNSSLTAHDRAQVGRYQTEANHMQAWTAKSTESTLALGQGMLEQ